MTDAGCPTKGKQKRENLRQRGHGTDVAKGTNVIINGTRYRFHMEFLDEPKQASLMTLHIDSLFVM